MLGHTVAYFEHKFVPYARSASFFKHLHGGRLQKLAVRILMRGPTKGYQFGVRNIPLVKTRLIP